MEALALLHLCVLVLRAGVEILANKVSQICWGHALILKLILNFGSCM